MKNFNIFFCVYSFSQINVLGIELHEINQVIKQLEKEVYFISYGRARKDKLIQNISTDFKNKKPNQQRTRGIFNSFLNNSAPQSLYLIIFRLMM